MPSVGFPILSALLLWWFATRVVLYLDGLPRSTCRWSMPGLSGVAVAALYGLWASSDVMTTHSADCALLVWGWHEMSFRTGFVTGPRTLPMPATALRAWGLRAHARQAVAAAGATLHGAAVERFDPLPYKASALRQKNRIRASFLSQ